MSGFKRLISTASLPPASLPGMTISVNSNATSGFWPNNTSASVPFLRAVGGFQDPAARISQPGDCDAPYSQIILDHRISSLPDGAASRLAVDIKFTA
jgi:hypothetical protein